MPLKFGDLTWQEIERLNKKKSLCMLPVAAIEQHGPHLPLATDLIVIQAVIGEITGAKNERIEPLIVLPITPYSKSMEHFPFPGTMALSSNTMLLFMEDLISSLTISDFTRAVIINGHGGNTSFLRGISQELSYRYGIVIYHIDYWGVDFFNNSSLPHDSPWEKDIHGGEIETSLMLYLAPELVKMERLTEANFKLPAFMADGITRAWLTKEISKSGVLGNPEKASATKGRIYFNYMASRILEELVKIQSGE